MSLSNSMLIRIASIQAQINVPGLDIPYVLQAEPYQTSEEASLACPFFMNELPVQGNHADIPIAAGQQYIDTVIDMMLAVKRMASATDLKFSVAVGHAWRDAVFAAFAQHVKLSSPALVITASTFSTPIQITTNIAHGYGNGEAVTISGVLVNTNANGPWIITVIDNWNFTLNGSVGNGVGGQTGSARKTQPNDMFNIVDARITGWGLEPYEYGSNEYLALRFPLLVREMFVTTIAA